MEEKLLWMCIIVLSIAQFFTALELFGHSKILLDVIQTQIKANQVINKQTEILNILVKE